MKLMTKELARKIPPLYSTEGKSPEELVAVVKYFLPEGAATWYVIEGSKGVDVAPDDWMFYGYVTGLGEDELGYFTLGQLKELRGALLHLPVERDIWFKPTPIKEVL